MSSFKSLREVIKFQSGGTPSKKVEKYWGGDIPWATVKDFTSTRLSSTQDHITGEGLRNSSAKLIPAGHVIIPTRMSVGKAAINTVDMAINQDLRALMPLVPLDASYLLHAMLSLKDAIVKKSSGATVKGVTQNTLYDLDIYFPSVADQKRIASVLGKVEGLIAQRKQHLQQLDDLLKSVFLKMFGDPAYNDKGWPVVTLETLMSELPINGLYKPQSAYGSGTKIIRIDSFYDGFVENIANLRLVEATTSERKKFEIISNDILVNRVNSIEYLGKIGIVPRVQGPMVYESNIMRFRINHDVMLPVFLMFYWRTPHLKRQIAKSAKRAVNQASINQKDVRNLLVHQPPKPLQVEFSSVVAKVEGVREKYERSLTNLETLYAALSQKAFKGELDLSRIPLPQVIQSEPIEEGAAVSVDVDVEKIPVPGLPDFADLTEPTGRVPLLREWLDEALGQEAGELLDAQRFLEWAQARIGEAYPDEEEIPLTVEDYETVKQWAFEQLEQGRLTQTLDEETNRVTVTGAHG